MYCKIKLKEGREIQMTDERLKIGKLINILISKIVREEDMRRLKMKMGTA